MAKGKHSPALFEVVHGKKRFDRTAANLRTPKWWFKGRHRGPAAPVMDVGEPPAFADEADPTLRGLPSPTADPAPERVSESLPERTVEAPPADYESALDSPTDYATPHPARRNSAVQLVVDRERQELFVRVRYTAAIISAFALVVVVALAYMGGRHFGRGPATALASRSSREIATGPVEKGVLDVGTHSGARAVVVPPAGTGGGTAPGAGGVSAQPAPTRPAEATFVPHVTSTTPRQPAPSAPVKPPDIENGRRIVGKQYVVVQSYAGDQQKLAEEARDFLLKNGVPCTIEKGIAGWPQNWHTVVGTAGFDRASGAQFEGYRERIIQVGKDFAGKSAWKQFDPRAIRWKETN